MWDVFIAHAGEDKDAVARPIAERLRALGLEVWYDEFTLFIGDSLRESIDNGLANSKFGVVIISPDFFKKNWPRKELDGLFAREINGQKVILPVWHNIDREEVLKYSPIIADKLAAKTVNGLDEVVRGIMRVIDPQNAYLSDGKLAVVIVPARIFLGAEGWATQSSSFTIQNKTDDPVYAVTIKAILDSEELETSDLQFELLERTNIARSETSSIGVDWELVRLNGFDDKGRKVVFLIVNSIGPREHKTFVIENRGDVTSGRESQLLLTITRFQDKPEPILRGADGNIAFRFRLEGDSAPP